MQCLRGTYILGTWTFLPLTNFKFNGLTVI